MPARRKWVRRNLGIVDKETGIWDLEVALWHHKIEESLAFKIASMYTPLMAADIGCGKGHYCKFFKDHGWPIVHGYEGTQNIKSFGVYNDIITLDLTKRRWIEIPYDFVLCTEVGEHIPKQHEQTFIDNVNEYVHKDLVLSWAIPGQRGRGHFNEQPNDYVIMEFEKRGLVFDTESTKEIKKTEMKNKYWKNTLLIFRRYN